MSYLEALRRWDAETLRRVTMKVRVAQAAERKAKAEPESPQIFVLSEPEATGQTSPPGPSH